MCKICLDTNVMCLFVLFRHNCWMSICVVYTQKLCTQLLCLNNAWHSCLNDTNPWNTKFCMNLEWTHEAYKFVTNGSILTMSWYIFFHSFFALRVLVGIFGFLTFVFMLFMFQNLAMGGHKTYSFGDVNCKDSASPLHLEWIAHVSYYSWKYCLMFQYPSVSISLFISLAQKLSTCITLSSILYLDDHLQIF